MFIYTYTHARIHIIKCNISSRQPGDMVKRVVNISKLFVAKNISFNSIVKSCILFVSYSV